MALLICLAVLGAAPQAQQPVRLVAPAFSVRGLEPQEARVFSDDLVQQLARAGVSIQTEGDVAAALGAERQQQLLGCRDEACLAGIADAMGSDGVLVGSVAKSGDARVLDVRIISKTGEPLAAESATSATDTELAGALPGLARALVEALRAKVEPGRLPNEPSRVLRSHALWPGLLGGLLGGLGTTMVSLATSTQSNIRNGTVTFASTQERDAAIAGGQRLELAGWVVLGVAAALVVGAVLIVIFGEGQ